MRRYGTVLETWESVAKVCLGADEGCPAECRCSCSFSIASETPGREIIASNPIQAAPGQQVMVEFNSLQALLSGAILFLFPVISIVLGIALGYHLGKTFLPAREEACAVLGAVLCLGISVLIISRLDIRFSKKSNERPVIIKIIPNQVAGEHHGSGMVC